MTEYDIKRGQWKKIEGKKLGELLEDIFGAEYVSEKDGKYYVNYGSIKPMETWMESKTELVVNVTMNPDVEFEEGIDSRRKYGQFLDKGTGFNAKKRKDRLKQKAKDRKL